MILLIIIWLIGKTFVIFIKFNLLVITEKKNDLFDDKHNKC